MADHQLRNVSTKTEFSVKNIFFYYFFFFLSSPSGVINISRDILSRRESRQFRSINRISLHATVK